MRVLHVSAYYAPAFVYGGPPRSIHGLCRALIGAGADVRVFTTDANGEAALPTAIAAATEYQGVPVRYFPRSWPNEPIGSRALTTALRAAARDVDLVHIHGLWNRVVWAASRAARAAGVPYVLSPRGMLQDAALAHRPWRKRLAYAAIERRTIDGASLLHATSEPERAALAALRPGASVVMIPNGIDLEPPPATGPSRAAFGIPADVPIVLFVGRIHRIKRVDLLLDAFALLKERCRNAHLVIAGPDEQGLRGPLTSRHPALAADVTWTGAVDAAGRGGLLAHAQVLAVCSDSESFGMTVLEAMAAARPVVVARTCGWADIEQLGAGILVDQQAPRIADALEMVLASPERARQMGERGRAAAAGAFAWPEVAKRFVSAYEAVADRRPGPREEDMLRRHVPHSEHEWSRQP